MNVDPPSDKGDPHSVVHSSVYTPQAILQKYTTHRSRDWLNSSIESLTVIQSLKPSCKFDFFS